MMRAWLLGVAALTLVATVAGCGSRGVALRTTTPAVIAGAYDWASVRGAIIRALERERFHVDGENGTQLTATYVRGRRMLQVGVSYTPQSYQITYLQSSGFNVSEDRTGVSRIHPLYDRIMRNVTNQVRAELERPSREQRQHELQVARAQRPVVAVAPGYVVQQPGYVVQQPGYVVQQPGYAVQQPGYAVQQPGYVVQQPGYAVQQPGYAAPQPPQGSAYVRVGPGVSGGVTGPGLQAGPSCEAALADMGHSSTNEMFCRGVDPWCAQELLYQGHSPTALMFCRDVEPSCAVTHLRGGGAPTALSRCR